ncbi:MAG: hypothetical protein LC798_05270 [Chloroflexi bacterium]|nr:hypothetical protein [Chloroflexota bacterium]
MARWRLADMGPDVVRLTRALLLLALVGGAVLITGQIMAKASKPARVYLTGGR